MESSGSSSSKKDYCMVRGATAGRANMMKLLFWSYVYMGMVGKGKRSRVSDAAQHADML